MVLWGVIFAVDVCGDDASSVSMLALPPRGLEGGRLPLHTHVIHGGPDRSAPDRVGVLRHPADLDWMGCSS